MRTDLTHYTAPFGGRDEAIDAVETWKEMGINMFRRRFQDNWFGMSPREQLKFFDEQGVPVRMNTASFDGQVASYNLVLEIVRIVLLVLTFSNVGANKF